MDEQIVSELMLTLSALLVRHEFCQMVVDCGGLRFILDSMVEFGENYKVIKQSFKLLKALAGNDDVKLQIIKNGGDNIIASSLEAHKVFFIHELFICLLTINLSIYVLISLGK